MFGLIGLSIALVGTLAAGTWDLKTTDIPDRLVFGMIGAGFLLSIIEGLLTGIWVSLAETLIVVMAFAAFGLTMYFAGAWGGGDGALLVAVGALLPAWPFASSLGFFPFPLAYFLSVFAVGLVYSVVYLSALLRRNKKAQKLFFKEFSKIRLIYIPIALLLLVFVPYLPAWLSIAFIFILVSTPPVYALSNASETIFYRRVPVKNLHSGDMLGEDIPRLKLYKRQMRGLTKAEVAKIRKSKRSVVVRSGVRYGIVFFLAILPLLSFALF